MPRRVLVLLLVLTTQCDALSLERISSLRGSSVREAQRMLETTNPPTVAPSRPTAVPTVSPTFFPSGIPTGTPSGQPTEQPSGRPSGQPSVIPTGQPSEQPSQMPTRPTGQPSQMPTGPTSQPTQMPTMPTNTPSGQPSGQPTEYPSGVPSSVPTSEPSRPTFEPTHRPTLEPTPHPTAEPTTATPTAVPTTAVPTTAPTAEPSTATPTAVPTLSPTPVPTRRPTPAPSPVPTTATPTRIPTPLPSATPTVRPTPEPSFKPTAFPSRSPTEQSIEDKYAEALLTDRLVYVIIGVAVLLILMCCLCFYCCASYGIPSLCLIAKTRVAKVYVDERGSEIQDFERRYRRPKSAERPRHAEHSNRRASAGSIVSATPGSVVGNRGRGESAESLSSIPEGQTRPASPEPTHRRHTTVSNESSMVPLGAPLVAMSPLSGVQHSESPALRNALDRKQEADSRPLTIGLPPRPAANSTPGPGADTPGADPMLAAMHGRPDPDESPATMQFNLQMWIRNLMATNDSLRQQLGLPLHVKSTRKINELVSSTSALSVSEINLLVQHAQDLSDENTSLQRLVDSGEVATGGESDDDRGRNKKRPRSSPTHRSKASSSSPKKVSQKQPIAEENSILSIEESNVESSAMDASAEMPPAEKRPSVSSKSSKAGRRSSDVLVKDHFKNDDGNSLPRRALGYKEEPELVSQTPAPDASRAQSEKKNKTEPNFVRVAKNSGKGETLEDIAKHDKIQHRKEFARKLYKQTST